MDEEPNPVSDVELIEKGGDFYLTKDVEMT
jgi:hypothetical protein